MATKENPSGNPALSESPGPNPANTTQPVPSGPASRSEVAREWQSKEEASQREGEPQPITRAGTGVVGKNNMACEAIYADATVRGINSDIEIKNGDPAGSQYPIGRVPGNAILDLRNSCVTTAGVAGTTLDVGIIKRSDGTGDPAALFAPLDVGAAGETDLCDGAVTPDMGKTNKRIWELAGLERDPGGELLIVATSKAAATADGVVSFNLRYCS